MNYTIYILAIFLITLYAFVLLCSCIYLFPLLIIKRFHSPVNYLSINVSITLLKCSVYWIIKYVLAIFYPDVYNANSNTCAFQQYIQNFVLCQVVYALCIVSINRLCIIIYSQKRLLKTKKWAIICIGIQWIFSIIISIPTLMVSEYECNNAIPLWFNIYQLITIAIVPSIILGITNSLIFIYTYASTRRIIPTEGIIRNPTLTNRDIHVLKHILFMFIVYIAGWTPIFLCIVTKPKWFNLLTFYFMQLLPVISMLIDILDLFFYNHELRKYFSDKILLIRRHITNTEILGTGVQYT